MKLLTLNSLNTVENITIPYAVNNDNTVNNARKINNIISHETNSYRRWLLRINLYRKIVLEG